MYRQYSFLLVLPLVFTFSVLFFLYFNKQTENTKNHIAVNAIVGDKSYLHFFGERPTAKVPDHIRIKTHLQYVEGILRNRQVDHLSEEQQRNRFNYLNHLREYYMAGEFPHNDGHSDSRRPTFISNDGDICAVGYLIEKSLGREIVEEINQKYKYAYITEIDAPVFNHWVESSGFTLRELAMIQPKYGPKVVEKVERNENHIDLSYGISSSVLAGTNAFYHINKPNEPWLFYDPSSNHWFGLAAGSGSFLLGIINLDNKQSYNEPINYKEEFICAGCFSQPLRKVNVTNNTRKAVSIANMGMGLFTMVRAGYHLIKGSDPRDKSSSASFGVTQLEPKFLQRSERVLALEMQVRF
ncbi:MAG: hypothetical protein GVY20_12520 [Bacteroidetes bacterium]|jgi:hypothetical protein|nr:hypothetical protein [Bacteroidota bacterium]